MIEIELGTPSRVQGKPVRQQSLWILLRLWLAAQLQGDSGWVREAQLREQFSATRNLRMIISRAYADFAGWGVRVGWGKDRARPLDMLALSGRNRGPHWLACGEAQRLRISLHGQPADTNAVLAWLGLPATQAQTVAAIAATGNASPAYWHAWAAARRDMLDGRLIVGSRQGALAWYRRAQALAPDTWQQALSLLQQAMVWRRAGNPDAARAVLAELHRHWHDEQAPEHAWLGAMAAIVSAWCAYAERDIQAARRILRQAAADPRWAALFEHHPRVRIEYANLQALIYRALALDESGALEERKTAARISLDHYQAALALANEAELFDAAASTASNLGWSLWLFAHSGLEQVDLERVDLEHVGLAHDSLKPNDPATLATALTWIALAAWLSEHHGVGGGCWNSIYLLRMVRNGGPKTPCLDPREFRRWQVLPPASFRTLTAPITLTHEWPRWLDLATALLADVDAGRLQADPLQQANLLLEVAWYQAYQGNARCSAEAAGRLNRRLRELAPADRSFFRDALRCLPGAC